MLRQVSIVRLTLMKSHLNADPAIQICASIALTLIEIKNKMTVQIIIFYSFIMFRGLSPHLILHNSRH